MDYAASRKVPEAELSEPAALRPAPVRWDRVEEARHDSAEDDVAVEVAALSNGARDNGSTSGSKGALEGEVSVIGDVYRAGNLSQWILDSGLKKFNQVPDRYQRIYAEHTPFLKRWNQVYWNE